MPYYNVMLLFFTKEKNHFITLIFGYLNVLESKHYISPWALHNDLHKEAPRYLLNLFFYFYISASDSLMKVSYLILVIIANNIYLLQDLNWYFYAIAISNSANVIILAFLGSI